MFSSIAKRISTAIHPKHCPECGHKVRETYCDICGYDLVRQAKASAPHRPVF